MILTSLDVREQAEAGKSCALAWADLYEDGLDSGGFSRLAPLC